MWKQFHFIWFFFLEKTFFLILFFSFNYLHSFFYVRWVLILEMFQTSFSSSLHFLFVWRGNFVGGRDGKANKVQDFLNRIGRNFNFFIFLNKMTKKRRFELKNHKILDMSDDCDDSRIEIQSEVLLIYISMVFHEIDSFLSLFPIHFSSIPWKNPESSSWLGVYLRSGGNFSCKIEESNRKIYNWKFVLFTLHSKSFLNCLRYWECFENQFLQDNISFVLSFMALDLTSTRTGFCLCSFCWW